MEITLSINGFNRMKNKIILMSLLLPSFLMMFTPSAIAVENGFFCSNCTIQEAAEIAKREAPPKVHCVIKSSPTEDYIEECSSLTNRYFVVNESSRQIFPFTVFHNNQKGNRQQLTLATRDSALTSEQRQAILKALDAKLQLGPALQELASTMSGPSASMANLVNSNLAQDADSALFSQSNTQSSDPTSGCANDPHKHALENALSESHRVLLEYNARASFQAMVTKSKYSSLKDAFTEWKFTGFGMQGGAYQGGFNISWQHSIGAYTLFERYVHFTELHWSVTLNEANNIDVRLSSTNSIIDGNSVASLLSRPTGALPPKISVCLLQVLTDLYFDKSLSERANDRQTQHFDSSSEMIGRNEKRDGGWICQTTLFDRNGNVLIKFLSRCR